MAKQYYGVDVQNYPITEIRNQFGSKGYDMEAGKQAAREERSEVDQLAIRLNDGEIMYVNVDNDGWVEIRFSDNMKKVIKANADYFASYYR